MKKTTVPNTLLYCDHCDIHFNNPITCPECHNEIKPIILNKPKDPIQALINAQNRIIEAICTSPANKLKETLAQTFETIRKEIT